MTLVILHFHIQVKLIILRVVIFVQNISKYLN